MRIVRLRWPLAYVFALALLVRLGAQLVLGAYTDPQTWEYETIANNLLAGHGYTYATGGATYVAAVASPLYVVLTAGVYLLTGHSQAAMLVLQALFGAATAALAGWLAGRVFQPVAAWAAGGLVAVDPALAVYSAELHPLSLDALAFLAVVGACIALPSQPGYRRLAGLGVLLGLAALTRTTVLSFVPLLLVWLNRFRAVRLISIQAITLVLVAIVIYAPWPIRNSIMLGEFLPGSSESTEWLWRGMNPNATGSSLTEGGTTMLEAAPPAFQAQVAAASEAGRIAIYGNAAAQYAGQHPAEAVRLYADKFEAFWWGSDATGLLYPAGWTTIYNIWYAAILLVAGVSVWQGWRDTAERPAVILIVASLLLVAFSQSFFYVEGRHRLAVEPLLLVLSGVGLVRLASTARLPGVRLERVRDLENTLS